MGSRSGEKRGGEHGKWYKTVERKGNIILTVWKYRKKKPKKK